ncbi:hypothetical protein N566_14200, partial [Streptomycetaceae bacterium MP113-05]
ATRWERHAARWSTRVLCVSEQERWRGEAAGIDARWAVIPNGVDTARFTPLTPQDTARARRHLVACAVRPGGGPAPSAAEDPLVVCVGRLCRQKGQDVLLRAWPAVTARVPRARLVLVGDGPDREPLRAAAPPGVLFAGTSPDPASWYAAADLVVLPSRWEAMALVPLEAMACGRPVLLTDVAGARESLPGGHQAACLAPPEDPEALASALVRLLADRDLREDLGAQAGRHVRASRDMSATSAAVEALYHELTGHPHGEREELISR